MKREVAIISERRSVPAGNALGVLLPRWSAQNPIDYKVEDRTVVHVMQSKHIPPVLILVGGPETNDYYERLETTLNAWRDCDARKRPSLLMIATTPSIAAAGVEKWVSQQSNPELFAPYINVYQRGLHDGMDFADINKTVDECLAREKARAKNIVLFNPDAAVSMTPIRPGNVVDFPELHPRYRQAQRVPA